MKAVQINKHGGPDVLQLVDIEKPKAQKGQVLVEAYASSINPFDSKLREGMVPNIPFPFTMGSDVAGIIVEVGEGVTEFAVGDKVYGSVSALAGATGAFAEFVASPVNFLAKMPNSIGFNEAASAVLTGLSAVQALLEHMDLKSRQNILIHGGAGGIGTIAIQIAKKIGAQVATTATGNEIEYVKNLGADEVIDYKNQKFDDMLFEYDAVFDTVGGEVYVRSFKVLKKGGILVSMVAPVNQELAGQFGVKVISQFTKPNIKHLNTLTGFIEDGTVKPHIDKIFTLDRIKEAFLAKEAPARSATGVAGGGGVKGKIAIEIHPVK